MLKSSIRIENGLPTLFIDGNPTTAIAYTTYFEERSQCEDFVRAGYRIFFVNISLTKAAINSNTGFSPFRIGVFEDPDHPDYSEFEDAVRSILKQCPDAIIFPRIYVSMPLWWTTAHPEECTPTARGGLREALSSERFRQDAVQMLRQVVCRIKNAEYAPRIGGWQICGGMTQEWFHHDLNGSISSPATKEAYRRWAKTTLGIEHVTLPSPEEFVYTNTALQPSENARQFVLFSNICVADSIALFAKTIKDETDHTQIVGTFYGYSFESNNTVLFGSHALRTLLDSPYLDFFSSPNAYTDNRALGIDWADMLPVDSVKLHGKLCFIECDIRTYLTSSMQDARPNEYPDDIYKTATGKSVWSGPPTAELSREAIRKCFAHQLTKASAIWWFDMWGGWYADPLLLTDLTKMKTICDNQHLAPASPLSAEIVFFADESSYAKLFSNSPHVKAPSHTRKAMGNIGAPYDIFMVEDAESVLPRYKAAIFPFPIPSEAGQKAIALCRQWGIPCLYADAEHYEFTVAELRDFLKNTNVHCYTNENDVIYVGQGYIGLHAAAKGTKTVHLPTTLCLTPVFGTSIPMQTTDTLRFDLGEHETALFAINTADQPLS